MTIRFSDIVEAGRPYDLVVRFSAAKLGLPPGRGSVPLVVMLTAPGFTVLPEVEQWIDVSRDAKEAMVTYSLTAIDADAPITRQIRAQVWRGNVSIASETYQTTVVPKGFQARRGSVAAARIRRGQPKAKSRSAIRKGSSAESSRAPTRVTRRIASHRSRPTFANGGSEARRKNGGGGGHRSPVRAMAKKSSAPKRQPVSRRRTSETKPALSVSREPRIVFHERVDAGKANALVVNLSDAISRVQRERLVTVEIPGGRDSVPVVVRLSAPGFTVKPKPEQTIKVGRVFDARLEQATFTLTALDPGAEPLTREIRADFWLGNNCVGAVTHRTRVFPKGYRGQKVGDGSGSSTSFVLDDDRKECDLVIIVEATKDDGQPPYEIHLRSRIPGADYASLRMGKLQITPRELSKTLNEVFSNFVSAYPVDGKPKEIAQWRESMRGAIDTLGKYLWQKLPARLRTEYFRLYDAGLLPVSIQVHSDEMLIPWELLIPHRAEGKAEVLKPLGVAHVMGRWRPGIGIQPRPQRLRIESACIVNPKYPGDTQLLWSILEAADLKAKLPVFKALSPATSATLKKLLARTDVQFVHYTGHGEYAKKQADLSTLILEGGDRLAAMDFVAAKLLSKGKPLIYLNACEAGSTGIVMGQMGGFAVQCLTSGCSGIIAPYWAVTDGTAKDFSLAFYEMLGKGRSIGEALRDLRAKHPKDPTFQAFAYFGDPWTQPQF